LQQRRNPRNQQKATSQKSLDIPPKDKDPSNPGEDTRDVKNTDLLFQQ
jgi:hypothetical protein